MHCVCGLFLLLSFFFYYFSLFGPAILRCPRYTNSYVLKTCKNIIVIQFLRKFNEPHSLFTRFNRHKHTLSLPFPLSSICHRLNASKSRKRYLFLIRTRTSTINEKATAYIIFACFGIRYMPSEKKKLLPSGVPI